MSCTSEDYPLYQFPDECVVLPHPRAHKAAGPLLLLGAFGALCLWPLATRTLPLPLCEAAMLAAAAGVVVLDWAGAAEGLGGVWALNVVIMDILLLRVLWDESPRSVGARSNVHAFFVADLSSTAMLAECTIMSAIIMRRCFYSGNFIETSVYSFIYQNFSIPFLTPEDEINSPYVSLDATEYHHSFNTVLPFSYVWFLSMTVWNALMHMINGNTTSMNKQQRQDAITGVLTDAKYTGTEQTYKAMLRELPGKTVNIIAAKPQLERLALIISECKSHPKIPLRKIDDHFSSKGGSSVKSPKDKRASSRPSRPRPQSRRRPSPGAGGKDSADSRRPLKLSSKFNKCDAPVCETLSRGGSGIMHCPKTDAPALAASLDGGGGKVALITNEPILRPDPNPLGEYYPSNVQRIAFEAGSDSLCVMPQHVTHFGDPIQISLACDDGEILEEDSLETTASVLITLHDAFMPQALSKSATQGDSAFRKVIVDWVRARIEDLDDAPARPVHRIIRSKKMIEQPLVRDDGTCCWAAHVKVKPQIVSALFNGSGIDGISVHWSDRDRDRAMFRIVRLPDDCDIKTALQKVRLHSDIAVGVIVTRHYLALRCLPQNQSALTAAVRGQGAADRLRCSHYVIRNVPDDIDRDALTSILTKWTNGFKGAICEPVGAPRHDRRAKCDIYRFRADVPPLATLPTLVRPYGISVERAPVSPELPPLTELKSATPEPGTHARAFQHPPTPVTAGARRAQGAWASGPPSAAARVLTPDEVRAQNVTKFCGRSLDSMDLDACRAVLRQLNEDPASAWATGVAGTETHPDRIALARDQLLKTINGIIERNERDERERAATRRKAADEAAAQQRRMLAEQHEREEQRRRDAEAERAAADRERERQRAAVAAAAGPAPTRADPSPTVQQHLDTRLAALRAEMTQMLTTQIRSANEKMEAKLDEHRRQTDTIKNDSATMMSMMVKMQKSLDRMADASAAADAGDESALPSARRRRTGDGSRPPTPTSPR